MGFSGSDIQALCTEAVLCCLKRSYPTISTSQDLKKIRINVETLKVLMHALEFLNNLEEITGTGM